MKTNLDHVHTGILDLVIQHPAVQGDIPEFVTLILRQALSVAEIREQVVAAITGSEVVELLGEGISTGRKAALAEEQKGFGRQQVTACEAAKILRYNPRYFNRKAKDWGLTKIRMSRTSCRYYLDEIEQLAVERGIRKTV